MESLSWRQREEARLGADWQLPGLWEQRRQQKWWRVLLVGVYRASWTSLGTRLGLWSVGGLLGLTENQMPLQRLGAAGTDKKVMAFPVKQKPTLQDFLGMLNVCYGRVLPEPSPILGWGGNGVET